MQRANNVMIMKFTKNQIAILNIFFENPGKIYYLRELSREIGKEPGVFQKDIEKLVKSGFLESYYQGNNRFFKLNKKHSLYKELRSIFLKTFGAVKQIKDVLIKVKNIEIAFIFGSLAQDKEDVLSDIDLMIIGQPDEDSLISEISKLEGKLKREINYHIFSPADWKKKLKVDSFLQNILAQPKIFLIGNKDELSRFS